MANTDKLADHFPGIPQENLDFIKRDIERTLKALANPPPGKAPSQALMTQILERTDLTIPDPTRRRAVKGNSDLGQSKYFERKGKALEEERIGDTLSDMGFDVKFNDGGADFSRARLLAEGLKDTRTPDLTIQGKIFDIYAHTGSSGHEAVAQIVDKVEKGQTHRVVMNLQQKEGADELIREVSKTLRERNPEGLYEVLVIQNIGGSASKLVHLFP